MLSLDIEKRLKGLEKDFELKIKIDIKNHDFIALSGPSGAGKTTILRILAGLESAKGKISLNDELFLDQNFCLPTQKRRIGYVFQDYALFPNLNVINNLLYVKNDKSLALKLLDLVDLLDFKASLPSKLSGGQKQRVALARALMDRPALLLLDEPLSALDSALRKRLQADILRLHEEFKTITILVSHDEDEIERLAKRKIVVKNGKIIDDYVLALYQNQALKARVSELNEKEFIINIKEQKLFLRKAKALAIKAGDEIYFDANKLKLLK